MKIWSVSWIEDYARSTSSYYSSLENAKAVFDLEDSEGAGWDRIDLDEITLDTQERKPLESK